MVQLIENLAGHLEKVIHLYQSWSDNSLKHDTDTMERLVLPDSGFSDLTKKYTKLNQSGQNFYYELKNIEILIGQSKSTETRVAGTIRLVMPDLDFSWSGKFISTCIKKDDTWLLDDIEIEWEN